MNQPTIYRGGISKSHMPHFQRRVAREMRRIARATRTYPPKPPVVPQVKANRKARGQRPHQKRTIYVLEPAKLSSLDLVLFERHRKATSPQWRSDAFMFLYRAQQKRLKRQAQMTRRDFREGRPVPNTAANRIALAKIPSPR